MWTAYPNAGHPHPNAGHPHPNAGHPHPNAGRPSGARCRWWPMSGRTCDPQTHRLVDRRDAAAFGVTSAGAAIRALLIEDNPGDARLILEMLRDAAGGHANVDFIHVDRLAAGLERLSQRDLEVVLLDLSLPDSQGFATFDAVHVHAPDVAVVVLSGLDDQTLAVAAVHAGAQDYLVKGQVDGDAILRSMRYAIERQRLEATRRDLERQRDEFFSSVSHDLRTPVAAIKAAIGVVMANMPPEMPPPLQRLLGNVDLAADELTALIEDLLEMARLQSGRVELWRSTVDLRDVVGRAMRSVEPLVQARGQQLRFSAPSQPVLATVDAERLGRVLRNLLGNAQKYGRQGGSVSVALECTPGEVRLAVADDGPGIALEDQERIFERFYRVSGSGSAGSGLGLAIARGLVELHGGRLWVESRPARGSTFHVALPLPE
jgi:phosphoserine phosphatase RsbU/P